MSDLYNAKEIGRAFRDMKKEASWSGVWFNQFVRQFGKVLFGTNNEDRIALYEEVFVRRTDRANPALREDDL